VQCTKTHLDVDINTLSLGANRGSTLLSKTLDFPDLGF
jgi:hypothetical protein